MTSADAIFTKPCPAITGIVANTVAILTGIFFIASVVYGLLAPRRRSP